MFEVVDRVISDYFGEGKVTCVSGGEDFPISVKFEKYEEEEEENFTRQGFYFKSGVEHQRNIKKVDNTPEADYKKTKILGFGVILELDNGICIYHPNQGQPFQVYPKSTSEGLS